MWRKERGRKETIFSVLCAGHCVRHFMFSITGGRLPLSLLQQGRWSEGLSEHQRWAGPLIRPVNWCEVWPGRRCCRDISKSNMCFSCGLRSLNFCNSRMRLEVRIRHSQHRPHQKVRRENSCLGSDSFRSVVLRLVRLK